MLGFILAIGRMSDHRWVRLPVGWVVELLRAVPVLVFMLLLYYGLPVVGIKMSSYWAVVIALILYNGSVLSEVIRAGVEALPRGQSEAGYAVGLRKSGVMRLILLPQAIRAMLPVIIAQLVVTLKDTALGFIITYPELLYFARLLGSNGEYGSPLIPAAMIASVIYVAMCLALSYTAHRVELGLRRSPKGGNVAPAEPAGQTGTDTELIVAQRGLGKFDSHGGAADSESRHRRAGECPRPSVDSHLVSDAPEITPEAVASAVDEALAAIAAAATTAELKSARSAHTGEQSSLAS